MGGCMSAASGTYHFSEGLSGQSAPSPLASSCRTGLRGARVTAIIKVKHVLLMSMLPTNS